MSTDSNVVIKTWAALMGNLKTHPNSAVSSYAYSHKSYSAHAVDNTLFGAPYYAAATALCRFALLNRLDLLERPLSEMLDYAEQIANLKTDTFEHPKLGALSVNSLAGLANHNTLSEQQVEHLAAALAVQARLREPYAARTGWALLSIGRLEDLPELISFKIEATPDPEAQYDGNPLNTLVALAQSIRTRERSIATQAWQAFLPDIPLYIAAEMFGFPELIWASRAMHEQILGGEPAQTMSWLVEQIEADINDNSAA